MSCGIVRRHLGLVWLVGGFALFAFVLTRQPLGAIRDAFGAMGLPLLAAPLIASVWFATRTSMLSIVIGGDVPWRELYVARVVGDGYNAVLPLAGIGGEPFKLKKLAQRLAIDRVLAALVCDRMVDNGVGFWFSAGCLAAAMPALALPAAARDVLWLYVAAATLLGLGCVALVITRLPGRFGARLARWLAGSAREPAPLDLVTLRRALVWSIATRVLQACETALLLYCIGEPLSLETVAFVDGALNAAGFVGFMLPQGLGMVEGTAVYMLGTLGVAPALATAFALARRGRVLLVSFAGIAIHGWSESRAALERKLSPRTR